jgi:replicative DNA helicase
MKLSVPIFQLKRRAKALSREHQVPLFEALNRVADAEGFRSWSLLAAHYAKDNAAQAMLTNLEPGDMVLVGARAMQGKTELVLNILAEARKSGRFCAFFTLEYTKAEACELLKSHGLEAESADFHLDTSDAICADHIIAALAGAKEGSVIAVDYLQALDHRRDKPSLVTQVSRLKTFAQKAGVIVIMISQIDRHYDSAAKSLPDMSDVRMPNMFDTSVFNKSCFMRDGNIAFSLST